MSILNYLAALVVLYLLWFWMVKRGLKNLSCWRTFSADAVFEGEEGELVEVVRNDRAFLIPWVRVESYISPHLQLGKQENLYVSGETFYCSCFTLMPYQQIRRKHRVKFLKRGCYDLGNATLTSGDLLGISRFWKIQKLSTPVLVYPRMLTPEEIPLPMNRVMGELAKRHQLMQDPFLVRGIRAYQPGDPVRDIHWPATARTGQVQVRVRDYTTRTRLLVVLNVQYRDDQWDNVIQEKDAQPIEHGIRLAATLCVNGLRSGLAAGFASNMPMGSGQDCTVLLPSDSSSQEEELLAAFSRLTIRCADKFPGFLDSLCEHSGMDMVIISRYDSPSIRSKIQKLESCGNQVTFHLLEGGGV